MAGISRTRPWQAASSQIHFPSSLKITRWPAPTQWREIFPMAVASSVVVRDISGVVTYSNGVDYVISSAANNLTTISAQMPRPYRMAPQYWWIIK